MGKFKFKADSAPTTLEDGTIEIVDGALYAGDNNGDAVRVGIDYKETVAIISQASTSTPTVVHPNSNSKYYFGNVSLSRTTVGVYSLTFPNDGGGPPQTLVQDQSKLSIQVSNNINGFIQMTWDEDSDQALSSVTIQTKDSSGNASDGILNSTAFNIRYYG